MDLLQIWRMSKDRREQFNVAIIEQRREIMMKSNEYLATRREHCT